MLRVIIPLVVLIAAVTVGAVTWKGGPARGAAAPAVAAGSVPVMDRDPIRGVEALERLLEP